MKRLPPELLPIVAAHMDDKDLKSLALTCHDFEPAARKQMVWQINGLSDCLAFIDLLLRDTTDSTTALRSSCVLNAHPRTISH